MEEKKKARRKALKILTKMDRTEQELETALGRSGFCGEDIRDAMDYVRSFGYLDDAKYAKKYVECYRERKSKVRLRYDLIRRGVDRELAEAALAERGEDAEKEALRTVLRKKWNREEKPEEKELCRLVAALIRQGFTNHDIWQVLREENLT